MAPNAATCQLKGNYQLNHVRVSAAVVGPIVAVEAPPVAADIPADVVVPVDVAALADGAAVAVDPELTAASVLNSPEFAAGFVATALLNAVVVAAIVRFAFSTRPIPLFVSFLRRPDSFEDPIPLPNIRRNSDQQSHLA